MLISESWKFYGAFCIYQLLVFYVYAYVFISSLVDINSDCTLRLYLQFFPFKYA